MDISRRQMLRGCACGFGHTALLSLLQSTVQASDSSDLGLHFTPRAKNVIFLFMHGGVSHIDTFDPKPELTKRDGQPLPYEQPLQFAGELGNLLKSPWKFKNYGESGLPVSDLFPHVGGVIDDICLLRSMHVEQVDHGGAILQLHTGSAVFTRPSMGSWITYGLGSENEDLPGFIALSPPTIHGAQQLYGSAFLPAIYQGTGVGDTNTRMADAAIKNLRPAEHDVLQRMQLQLLREQNVRHQDSAPHDPRLDARIESFELAYRMQMSAPEVFDITDESEKTLSMYGVNQEPTDNYGRQCLLARRLVERGVRFVQCSHSYKWDQHGGLLEGHTNNALEVDQPIAALIKDLKQRGLLDETLVIWGTEFGRTPGAEGHDGRDHNPYGFTMWMAGGGVKGGMTYGATDDFGYFSVQDKVSMYDFHATVLHLLGIDHTQLTYRYAGRDFRLTDVYGSVIADILA